MSEITTPATNLPLTNLIFVDVETAGLSARFDQTTPVYVTSVLKVDEETGAKIINFRNLDRAIDFIHCYRDRGYTLVAHNLKFDYSVLTLRGLEWELTPQKLTALCTMVLAYFRDSSLPSYSLSYLTGAKEDIIQKLDEMGYWVNNGLEKPKSLKEFWEVSWVGNKEVIDTIADYCASDLKATYALYKRLAKWYNSNPQFIRPIQQLEIPMIGVLSAMELEGAYVDHEQLSSLIVDLDAGLTHAEEVIKSNHPCIPKLQWSAEEDTYKPVEKIYKRNPFKNKGNIDHYIEPDGTVGASDPYIIGDHCPFVPYNPAAATGHNYWLLQQTCPEVLELTDRTKGGKPSLNKAFFSDVADQIPPQLPIAKVIKLDKYLSMARGIQNHIADDGRIHASFQNCQTRTGRLSCTSP